MWGHGVSSMRFQRSATGIQRSWKVQPAHTGVWAFRARALSALLTIAFGSGGGAFGQSQSCTGLCLQQISCANNGTTSITGNVYAPNGTDPLPNVTVYIPNAPVQAFTPGVSCPVVGQPPSGSPLVGTTTAVDGSFTIEDVPVGSNIPLVIVSGRWRRQLVIPSVTACTNNPLDPSLAVMPQNQSQGDIPLFAIATGSVDQVECVLRKVGISDSEFTNPGGGGRINLYSGSGQPGAVINGATPSQASLMESFSALNSYDVLMLPCQGTPQNNVQASSELSNFISFANAGGRVYASHYSYVWMYQNPPFNGVANWAVGQGDPPDGDATVNTNFTAGQTLSTWLQNVGASTSPGQMELDTLRVDTNGIIAPTQSWLTLDNTNYNNPVMQFVFDTPIASAGSTVNQCGRVLFNEYHVENGSSSTGEFFPNECVAGPMSPQEKLLEYMLFELTDEGGQPSLAPLTQDFGSETLGYSTAPVPLTWTNNSSFTSQVTSATATGDFSVVSNNCSSVAGGASCQINVVFSPTTLGARSGTLSVVSSGNGLTAALTGTGVPGFSISATSLTFGNLDVGATATQTLTLTNLAPQALPTPAYVANGEYAVNTAACGASVPALSSCTIAVTFRPTTTGPQSGTATVNSTSLLYSGLGVGLNGNGVDFAITLNPTSGTAVAGDPAASTATITPIAGFASQLKISCGVGSGATGANCGLGTTSITPTTTVTATVSISTTSQYTVVGYSGVGGRDYLWLIAVGSGGMLWMRRKTASTLLRRGLLAVLLAAIGLSMTGCSGQLPTQNAAYTGPGNYTVTVSATDGFLVHSATYSLTVTAN